MKVKNKKRDHVSIFGAQEILNEVRLERIMKKHEHRDPDNCDICFLLDQWQVGGLSNESKA